MNDRPPTDTAPTILIVDDDETTRMLARANLEDAGYAVIEAHDGFRGLELGRSLRPVAVFLDVVMPGLSGYDVCDSLRKSPGHEDTPIVMMTSLDDVGSINRAYEAGATEFVTKPVNWAIELPRLRYMLRASRMIGELKVSESQLRHSQKMEAVGRLAGGVAHDFNNLLTVIMSYCALALDDLDSKDWVEECLREVYGAGERAATLTKHLLAFSRKQVLQPKVLDLNAVIEEMEKMVSRLISTSIHLETRLDKGLEPVLADRGQIEQVVMNLVINAADAMPDGGSLVVSTGRGALEDTGAESRDGFLISVQDSGSGMSAEVQSHMFEPFFTTKEHGKGTGLGLSTVYGIVTQSGGRIRVESAPGEGTCFHIVLPFASEGATLDEEPGIALNPEVPVGTETLLLVEDETGVRASMARYLSKKGYTVLSAQDGREALDFAERAEAVDLLITDVMMPRMGGGELSVRMKEQFPDVPQIFISGYADSDDVNVESLRKQGVFLPKPFGLDELGRVVRNVLDAKASGDRGLAGRDEP